MEANPHNENQSLLVTERATPRSVGRLSIISLILINLVNLLVLGLIIIA